MTCRVIVTFEYETLPPETFRSEPITATVATAIASRGLRTALQTIKPHGWSSCVVLLDRFAADGSRLLPPGNAEAMGDEAAP